MGTDIHTIGVIYKDNEVEYLDKNIANNWRSYDSFAVLASVRIYDEWPSIDNPRGFPEWLEAHIHKDHFYRTKYSLSKTMPDLYGIGMWMGDHGHSYVSLAELKECLKSYEDKQHKIVGVVDDKEWERCHKENDTPKEWCVDTNRPDCSLRSWTVPALECLRWLELVVVHLELLRECKYKKSATDEEVFLVFGFDS